MPLRPIDRRSAWLTLGVALVFLCGSGEASADPAGQCSRKMGPNCCCVGRAEVDRCAPARQAPNVSDEIRAQIRVARSSECDCRMDVPTDPATGTDPVPIPARIACGDFVEIDRADLPSANSTPAPVPANAPPPPRTPLYLRISRLLT